ncbi:hypothetical protein ACIBH1_24370 [Nonomuraea sp. NPDC050663]|uniref:hypothetical protein n=1 Tax=Nonomuraea sp. NPDC050663 TaxID=3364370 RepID=UPI0037A8339E
MPHAGKLLAGSLIVFAAAGCTGLSYDSDDVTRFHHPQNEGANASFRGVHLRNAYLLGQEEETSSPVDMPLYLVIVNAADRPDRLERVQVEGGGEVRLAGPIELPPHQPVGAAQPIGTVSGVKGSGSAWMVFQLREAGAVRLAVPVKPRTGLYATMTPSPMSSSPMTPSPTAPSPTAPSPSPSG